MTKRILIGGLGRSGTSWVQKVFDHHPDVFSIFEPDLLSDKLFPETLEECREYCRQYFNCRALRAMRKRPIRVKPYRNRLAHHLRLAWIYAASSFGKLLPTQSAGRIPVPDFTDRTEAFQVVKIVRRPGLLGDYAKSNPDIKFICVLRHPCGYAASNRKGIESGKMPGVFLPPRDLLGAMYDFGRPVGDLREDDFSLLEIMAYQWSVENDLAIRAAKRLPNLRVFIYEDICADPRGVFQDMFDWVELPWHPECDAFIDQSLAANSDADGYHDLVRDPLAAAHRWKQTLTRDEQSKIMDIVSCSAAAQKYALS